MKAIAYEYNSRWHVDLIRKDGVKIKTLAHEISFDHAIRLCQAINK